MNRRDRRAPIVSSIPDPATTPGPNAADAIATTRRPYSAPRVVDSADLDELLEILGPAQANYGGMGMPSDQAIKTDVTAIDEDSVLEQLAALPISRWRYRSEGREARHIGTMAQDFHAVFGLGDRDTVIYPVDANGVSLAAAKALRGRLARAEARVAALESDNADLRRRLGALERWVGDAQSGG